MSSPTINERIESFLAAIASDADAPDAAETHIETWLAYILSKLGGSGEHAGLNGLTKWETLWENASPTSDFSSQTITLDLSKYDYFIILYRYATSSATASSVIFKLGYARLFSGIATSLATRGLHATTLSISFENAYISDYASITSGLSSSYSYDIPIEIIGVKVVS